VQIETRVGDLVREELARRGHIITSMPGFSGAMGNGEAVMRDARRGVNFAGSDPRTDGAAIPEQPVLPALKAQR
jgi:gamma-glutamyltranspeptidase/glutathione hydrolase